jgi:hypothetical protein
VATADAHKRLYSTKFHAFVKGFGVVTGAVTVVQLSDTEQQPVSVRNFAIDSAFHDDGVVGSTVEELHILSRAVFLLEFYRLKRLHIHWRNTVSSDFPVEHILKHSQLTHIAISVPHWGFATIAHPIVGRTKTTTSLPPSYPPTDMGSSPTSEQLPAITDTRFVMGRVSIDNVLSFLNEWEHNIAEKVVGTWCRLN